MHGAEIVMHPPGHELKLDYSRVSTPDSRFRFKMATGAEGRIHA